MRLLLAALVAAVPLAGVVPASASPVVLSVSLSGEWFPGLSTLPTPQSATATGTALDVATATTYSCRWDLTATAETFGGGAGVWQGTCGPYAFTACTFVHGGATMTVACGTTWGGSLAYTISTTRLNGFSLTGVVNGP